MTTTADKVRAAARYVDTVGLHKGWFSESRDSIFDAVENGEKCCMLGALRGHGVDVFEGRWVDDLGAFLAQRHPGQVEIVNETTDGQPVASVARWNDDHASKEDVVDLLTAYADHLEEATDGA